MLAFIFDAVNGLYLYLFIFSVILSVSVLHTSNAFKDQQQDNEDFLICIIVAAETSHS